MTFLRNYYSILPKIFEEHLISRLDKEDNPKCIIGLLNCCSKISSKKMLLDHCLKLFLLFENSENSDVKVSILNCCSKIMKECQNKDYLMSFAILVKESLDAQHPTTLREASVRALAENNKLLVEAKHVTRYEFESTGRLQTY